MKKLFLILALLSVSAITFAQSPLPLGHAQINAGVGFSDWGVPLYFGIDYSVHKDITIGGELSFRSYYDNYNNTEYRHGIMGITGNGNYHFNSILNISQDWDFYAGLNLGFYTWTSSSDYPGNRSSGIWLGAQIGGRYYFSEKVGINLELGGGTVSSGGKFGFTFKL
jgi:outer membrane immunogenic protein